MGYYTRYDGEISIEPPLTWNEIRNSDWATGTKFTVKLRIAEEIVETDDGTLTRRTADALIPLAEDCYKGDVIPSVQKAIEDFPGHIFNGRFDCKGEDAGDLWRLVVRNGGVKKVEPRIVWPDEES